MTQPESLLPASEKWPDLFDEQVLESLERRYRRGRLVSRRTRASGQANDDQADIRPNAPLDEPS